MHVFAVWRPSLSHLLLPGVWFACSICSPPPPPFPPPSPPPPHTTTTHTGRHADGSCCPAWPGGAVAAGACGGPVRAAPGGAGGGVCGLGGTPGTSAGAGALPGGVQGLCVWGRGGGSGGKGEKWVGGWGGGMGWWEGRDGMGRWQGPRELEFAPNRPASCVMQSAKGQAADVSSFPG
jgi:hypothetical protein